MASSTAASTAASTGIIDWNQLPAECDPGQGGGLGPSENASSSWKGDDPAKARTLRKRVQVESFFVLLREMLPRPDGESSKSTKTVVDFGCGSGNLTLPLAALLPHVHFVGVDMNKRSIEILKGKAASAGLSNVECFAGLIEEYSGHFDVAVGLHACGNATDMAMESAYLNKAAYIMCPCCVGKLKFSLAGGTSKSNEPVPDAVRVVPAVTHPRSSWFQQVLPSPRANFAMLARAADVSHAPADAKRARRGEEDDAKGGQAGCDGGGDADDEACGAKSACTEEMLRRLSKLHVRACVAPVKRRVRACLASWVYHSCPARRSL